MRAVGIMSAVLWVYNPLLVLVLLVNTFKSRPKAFAWRRGKRQREPVFRRTKCCKVHLAIENSFSQSIRVQFGAILAVFFHHVSNVNVSTFLDPLGSWSCLFTPDRWPSFFLASLYRVLKGIQISGNSFCELFVGWDSETAFFARTQSGWTTLLKCLLNNSVLDLNSVALLEYLALFGFVNENIVDHNMLKLFMRWVEPVLPEVGWRLLVHLI